MDDALADRVDALERAVTDGECEFTELTEEADAVQRLADLETQLEEIDDRVAELEAATQALRGYVGNIRSVNRDIEQRAETALAKVEAIEATGEGPGQLSNSTEGIPAPAYDDRQAQDTAADGGLTESDRRVSANANTGDASDHDSRATAAGTPDRCHACGRTHADSSDPTQATPHDHREPTASDHQSTTTGNQRPDTEWQPTQTDRVATDREPSQTDGTTESDEDMLPEETQETGTLQRVRELL